MNTSHFFTWNVSPEIISIGMFHLRWYGLLFAMCFVVGYNITKWMFKIENKKEADLESLTYYMVLSTVIGARLGHCLFYGPQFDYVTKAGMLVEGYLSHPLNILKVWEGGLASHGAALGILFGLYLYSRKRADISYMWILDRMVIIVALSGFFIRMGNFFNSEIIGKVANVPWAIIFQRHDLMPRHPSQLYEAFFALLVFFFLLFSYKKYKAAIRPGFLFSSFLMLIFTSRFFIEFLKEPQIDEEKTMFLDLGQLLSIPLILAGIYIFFFWREKNSEKS